MQGYGVCAALIMATAGLVAPAWPQPQREPSKPPPPVPTRTFTDPVNGVSFRYPAVWRLQKSNSFYGPPSILGEGQSPLAAVAFKPAGEVYAKTNLDGLEFTYLVRHSASRQACDALAFGNMSQTTPPVVHITINGVSFLQVETSGAGMCHQQTGRIYGAFQGGRCYLFEAEMHTLCAGVVDGTRALTPAETRALNRHLDSIMPTVTISLPSR